MSALMGSSSERRHHVDLPPGAAETGELDLAVDHREQGVVLSESHVAPREEPGPALAHQDVAGAHPLAPETFDAQALRVRLAVVLRRRLALLVSHERSPYTVIAVTRMRVSSSRWPRRRR